MSKLNVKAGDKVIVRPGGWNRSVYISEVEKITPKGFIKVNGILYHPHGRERTADSFHANWIEECTEEKEKEIFEVSKIDHAIKKMHETTRLTFEQAIKILEILGERK